MIESARKMRSILVLTACLFLSSLGRAEDKAAPKKIQIVFKPDVNFGRMTSFNIWSPLEASEGKLLYQNYDIDHKFERPISTEEFQEIWKELISFDEKAIAKKKKGQFSIWVRLSTGFDEERTIDKEYEIFSLPFGIPGHPIEAIRVLQQMVFLQTK